MAEGTRISAATLLVTALLPCAARADPVTASPAADAPPKSADAAPTDPEAQKTQSARRHFRIGVKLYRDTNYPGALAEFEAAYRDKPGPGSLQNVALCLKALFRYAEAATSLKLLLERHGAELSEAERAAMQTTVSELESLVGTLKLDPNPANAVISIDGRVVSPEAVQAGIVLNVGEHTLLAEAPGYERRAEIVRIASLAHLTLPIRLRATAGFLNVTTSDPKAAIAIDDEPLAFHAWSGPLTPEVDHVVQVYREGFEPFEQTVHLELGKTLDLHAELGAPTGAVDEQAPLPAKPSAPPPSKKSVGLYGLLTLSAVGLNDTPLNLQVDGSNAHMTLPSFGLRGGYRLSEPIAVELALDIGRLDAKGACEVDDTGTNCVAKRTFSLRSVRVGPNLRLMTRGDMLRFATSIGAGIVSHRLELSPTEAMDGTMQKGGSASSVDPYFCLELGAAFNYRHLLLELGVIAFIEGATGLHGAFDQKTEQAVFSNGTLPMLGLVLKGGYSSWGTRH